MAVDPVTVATGIGAIAGLFSKKKKAPRNLALDWLNKYMDAAGGLYGRTNFKDIDQLSQEAWNSSVMREADRATGNLLASDFANGGTPLANSERGVAQGLIARDSAYKIADRRASDEASRPLREFQFLQGLAGMAQGGAQGNNAQAQLNQQYAAQGDAQIMGIANLIANSLPQKKDSPTSSPAGKNYDDSDRAIFRDTSKDASDWRYRDNYVPPTTFYDDPAIFSRGSGIVEGDRDYWNPYKNDYSQYNFGNPNTMIGSIGKMIRGIKL